MKNIDDFPELLATQDIMELFGLGQAGAYRLMRRKDFPAFKMMGRYMVMKKSLLKWLDRQEQLAYRGKGN